MRVLKYFYVLNTFYFMTFIGNVFRVKIKNYY